MSREAYAQIEDDGGADVPVARLRDVSLRYSKACALDEVTIDIPAGCMAVFRIVRMCPSETERGGSNNIPPSGVISDAK